jgi:hypothetical protein
MGYCINQRYNKFFLVKEHFNDALLAIKSLAEKENKNYFCIDHNFASIDNLSDMLSEWRWEANIDDNGNINDLFFFGEKYGDDLIMFSAIAPWVKPGSYIEMSGEDGSIWRWVFDGTHCKEVSPKIEW